MNDFDEAPLSRRELRILTKKVLNRNAESYADHKLETNSKEVSADDFIETVAPGMSKDDVERIRQTAIENAKNTKHGWRLKGGYLICDTCPFPHRAYIGHDKVMTGIDEAGNPILIAKRLTSSK